MPPLTPRAHHCVVNLSASRWPVVEAVVKERGWTVQRDKHEPVCDSAEHFFLS